MMLTIQREIKLRFTNEIAESFDLPLFMTGIVPVSETSSHFGANRCDGDVGSGNSLHWLTYYIKIRQKVCQSHLIKLKFKPCICACSFVGTKSWIGSTIDRWFNRLLQGFWSLLEVKALGFSKDTDFIEISRFFNDCHIQRPRHLDCFDEIHQDHTLIESPNIYYRVLNKRGGWNKSQTLN